MKSDYRPEIDGIRAIAVLSIIIYHAEFKVQGENILAGGFLGVDIFFVISGFLITSLLIKEIHRTGTISIRAFYERRALRILPALFTTLLLTIPFAWLYLLPNQLIDYAKSLLSSLLFGSNFYWNNSMQEYSSESSLIKPLMHTWSLAIEEQFYIVIPLTILLAYKLIKSHHISMLFLISGFILSLIASEIISQENASLSFYMLHTRAWELLTGCILAFLLIHFPSSKKNPLLNNTLPFLGFGLILYSFFFIHIDNTNHPGIITLLPVSGTVLIIWFGNNKDYLTQILSSRPFIFIGIISYSLYLWHYPVFAFARINNPTLSSIELLILIGVTFIIALASFFMIEKPLRKISHKVASYYCIASLFFTLTLISIYFIKHEGLPSRLGFNVNLLNSFIGTDYQEICGLDTENKIDPYTFFLNDKECNIGQKQSPDFLLIGDSHARSLLSTIHTAALNSKKSGLFIFAPGCPPILNTYPNRAKKEQTNACKLINDNAYDLVKKREIKTVFLVARWNYYTHETAPDKQEISNNINTRRWSTEISQITLRDNLRDTIEAYSRLGVDIVILRQAPHQNGLPIKIYRNTFRKKSINNLNDAQLFSQELDNTIRQNSISRIDNIGKSRVSNSIISDVAKSKNVYLINPVDSLCSDICPIGNTNTSFYEDDDHLSITGAKRIQHEFETYFKSKRFNKL